MYCLKFNKNEKFENLAEIESEHREQKVYDYLEITSFHLSFEYLTDDKNFKIIIVDIVDDHG